MSVRFLKWRLIYGLLESAPVVALASLVLGVYGAVRGARAADGVLDWLEHRYGYSGWPMYVHGWRNLHTSRWVETLRRMRRGPQAPRRRYEPPSGRLRVACVGRFAGLLGFPKELLAACPVDLIVADVAFRGQTAGFLRDVGVDYWAVDLDEAATYEPRMRELADFIARARVDLLINLEEKRPAHDLLDRLDVACIANICVGSNLLHHPNVDIQFFAQPQADYFVIGNRMFCGTTGRRFDDRFVWPFIGFMDPRGIAIDRGRTFREREPLIVFHGSLFKVAESATLDVLMRLLADDSSLTLALVGQDDGRAMTRVSAHAARYGVHSRVHYEGQFSAVRRDGGIVGDEGWRRLLSLLGRARLAPDPFPRGGGSARFEAYAMGVASVHMGVRFDRDAWCRPQPGQCEIPFLRTRLGTAWSVEEYQSLCRRCLSDGSFADELAMEQLALARPVADAGRWWTDVLAGHEAWAGQTLPAAPRVAVTA